MQPRRPPFDPNLGQPHKLPPTPTLRQLQMQAAHRGRGPGGWQAGGAVGYQGGGVPVGGGYGEYVKGFLGKTSGPGMREWDRDERNRASHIQQAQRNLAPPGPRGWQGGGSVRGFAQGDMVEKGTLSRLMESMIPSANAEIIAGIGELDPVPYATDPRWALMDERYRLQQQLQMADEVTAQEILMQIREITKELEMEARNFGMAGGGVASLMGGVRGYQGGGAPRRTGALHGSITGDPSSGRWTEHFPVGSFWPNVPRLSSIYSGWGTVDKRVPGQTITSFNNQNLPYPNRPPGGG